jgi:hypothetical protein
VDFAEFSTIQRADNSRCACRLFSSCRLFELSSATDFRRMSLTGPAMQLLQQPLLPQLSSRHGSGSSSSSAVDQRMYFWPINAATEQAMEQKWAQVLSSCRSQASSSSSSYTAASTSNQTSSSSSLDDPAAAPTVVPVMFGRQLAVPRAASGVASFHFLDLCGGPLGAADYMALAQNYHTVFITGDGSVRLLFSPPACASCA